LSDFNQTQIFLIDFKKNTEMSNFMKIHQVVAELFQWTGGQTDIDNMAKLVVTFCSFVYVPKNVVM
jgi:hypothetical protein